MCHYTDPIMEKSKPKKSFGQTAQLQPPIEPIEQSAVFSLTTQNFQTDTASTDLEFQHDIDEPTYSNDATIITVNDD